MSISALVMTNALLTLVWVLLVGTDKPLNYVVGALLGFGILTLSSRDYGRRVGGAVLFGLFVLWQILKSSVGVSRAVLFPTRHLAPGVVAVPLEVNTPLEVLLLATVITLTPGTISVESGTTVTDAGVPGERVLFVHALSLPDPDALRASIKHDFERRILGFTRPTQVEAHVED